MTAPITLTTDFGLADPYVASMKGIIYSINPGATIIDVSHEVRPQAIEQAVFILEYALPYLPPGAIHVMVVDPGVGTDRRALALVTPNATFVGPDNGLLSGALPADARAAVAGGAATIDLPDGYEAYELANDAYHRKPVSVTFHGRDIFSPVAAHLSAGASPGDLGPPVSRLITLPPFRAQRQDDGSIAGRIVHIDRYGNLITNVRADQVPSRDASIDIAGRVVHGISRSYAEAGAGRLAAIVASTGYLAIVVPNGSAAASLNADLGEPVAVRA